MSKEALIERERQAAVKMAGDIFIFTEVMFGLVPQPAKPEYQKKLAHIYSLDGEMFEEGIKFIKPEWFGDYNPNTTNEGFYDWFDFEKGKHITWQQTLILMCANKVLQNKIKRRISIVSGHGIGKSSSCAIIVLWFLFGRVDSQIACTAPTATQMHDVLWKELALWINRMPEKIRRFYEHNKDYIRMTERPDSWFARAKTSSKENSEALAGVHSESGVMLLSDEASGIEEPIFVTMDATLTSENFLVMLIGNPTRTDGYFYDSHHKNVAMWVTIQFSGIDSPLVSKKYEADQAKLHGGRDTEQYGIRVLGKFPSEDTMSKDGYVRLIGTKDVNVIPKSQTTTFGKNSILGVDPSGEGDDKTVFTIRDDFKARVIFKESTSNSKYIAEKILTFIDMYELDPANVVVDAFGIGTTIASEVSKASPGKVIQSINVGELCDYEDEKEEYMNKRALYFHKGLRGWIRQGGQIVEDAELEAEIETIYYKRNTQGKVQIMPKVEMKKRGYKSPNCMDSIMLTFHRQVMKRNSEEFQDDWVDRATNAHDPFGTAF